MINLTEPIVLFHVVAIGILALAYAAYELKLFAKLKKKKGEAEEAVAKLQSKDLKTAQKLMKEAEKWLRKKQLKLATKVYGKIIEIYEKKLKEDQRKRIIKRIGKIHSTILTHQIKHSIKEINHHIAAKNKSEAIRKYKAIQHAYSKLPHSWKKNVGKECMQAFHQISAIL